MDIVDIVKHLVRQNACHAVFGKFKSSTGEEIFEFDSIKNLNKDFKCHE